MVVALFKGLVLGAGMIIPIGAQNSFLLSQGIKRNHHILAASICIFCDVLLINIGIFGGGALIASNTFLMISITTGGIAFLLTYAGISFLAAWRNRYQMVGTGKSLASRNKVIATTLAVTLLNPHVYLDTVIVLGSVGGTFDGDHRVAFAAGTVLASILWFYALVFAASRLAPWLSRAHIQRNIDIVVGIIMAAVAYSLLTTLLEFL